MTARNAFFVQASGPTGLISVEDARLELGALLMPGATVLTKRSGFVPGDVNSQWGFVFETAGTPNGFVHVAPFQLIQQTTRAAAGGPYIETLDAQFDVNILSTPADGTNPRNDLIVAQQSDTFYGDGVSTWTIRQVVGTPAGSPSDPAVSGSGDYIPLARVRVDANATAIPQAKITDLRTAGHVKSLTGGKFTVASGGLLPVEDATAESNVAGKYNGMQIWRRDLKRRHTWDGAHWIPDPGTILGSFDRTTDKTFSGTEVLAIRLDSIAMYNGYDYGIRSGTLRVQAVSGETGIINLRGDLTGAAATIASTLYQAAEANPSTAFTPVQSPKIDRKYSSVSDVTTSWQLSVARSGGSGSVTLSSSATRPTQLYVVFLGPTPSSSGSAP